MTYVLKHPCYRPALSWTSFLLHFIFTDFFETGKKLLSHIGKETKAQGDRTATLTPTTKRPWFAQPALM